MPGRASMQPQNYAGGCVEGAASRRWILTRRQRRRNPADKLSRVVRTNYLVQNSLHYIKALHVAPAEAGVQGNR